MTDNSNIEHKGQQGTQILICGDCLAEMAKLPDKSIDMVLCDLPYGTTARNKWDNVIPLDLLWEQYGRIVKDDGVIALWSQMPFTAILAASNMKLFRYEWIIEKTNATGFLNANRMPMKAHENVLIFYKKLPVYHPQMTHGHERKISTAAHKRNSKKSMDYGEHGLTTYDSTDRYPRDVLTFSWDKQKSRLHPTQMPVAACEYFIATYTDKGDTVLDNCMGSGTTGVACQNLGRNFIGIELEKEYFDIAEERLRPLLRNGN